MTHAVETQPMNVPQNPILNIHKGTCYVLFAYNVGYGIDLDAAERRITAIKERSQIKHKRRAPSYFDFSPAPVRMTKEIEPLTIGDYRTRTGVDLLLYDFGAVSVTYSLPIEGEFAHLLSLTLDLYENALLLTDSRRQVDELIGALEDAVERPHAADAVEDFAIFQIEASTPADWRELLATEHAQVIAQLLRSETQVLADQEVRDAVAQQISFGTDDVTVIDWNAALVVGREMDDVRAVLEFANVELLEMRLLDEQLDQSLDQAYDALSKRQGIG